MTPVVTRTRHRYGKHSSQVADLWRQAPNGSDVPVVVLIHGGFWRFAYTKQLMNGLAEAIAGRGLAVLNIEYRRLGPLGGGWPTTFDDVAAAVDYTAHIDGLDITRVVTCGHSAGGHLALWAAAHSMAAHGEGTEGPVRVKGALALAGVADLRAAADLGLSNGVAARLLGGGPEEVPERYRSCSPAEMLPAGVPQVLVHGTDDTTVPVSMSEQYCQRAKAAGDDATFVPLEGTGHMELIKPRSAAWATASKHLEELAW